MTTPAKSPGLLRSAFHFVASTPSLLTALIGGKIDTENENDFPRSSTKPSLLLPVTPGTSKKGVHFRENENQVREVERWIQPSDIFDSNEDSSDHDSPEMDILAHHHSRTTSNIGTTGTSTSSHVEKKSPPLDTLALVHLHNKEQSMKVPETKGSSSNNRSAIRKLNLENINDDDNDDEKDKGKNFSTSSSSSVNSNTTTSSTSLTTTTTTGSRRKPLSTSASASTSSTSSSLSSATSTRSSARNASSSRNSRTMNPSSSTTSSDSDSSNGPSSSVTSQGLSVSTRRSKRLDSSVGIVANGKDNTTSTASSVSTTSNKSKNIKDTFVTKKGSTKTTITNDSISTLSSTAQRAEARRRKRQELEEDDTAPSMPVVVNEPVIEARSSSRRGKSGIVTTKTTGTKGSKSSTQTTTSFDTDDTEMGFIERDVRREHHEPPLPSNNFVSPFKQRKLSPSTNNNEKVSDTKVSLIVKKSDEGNTSTNTTPVTSFSSKKATTTPVMTTTTMTTGTATKASTPTVSSSILAVSTTKNTTPIDLPIVSGTSPLTLQTTESSNQTLSDDIMNDILPSSSSSSSSTASGFTSTPSSTENTSADSVSPRSTVPALLFSFNTLPKSDTKTNSSSTRPASVQRSASPVVKITSTPLKFSFGQLRTVSQDSVDDENNNNDESTENNNPNPVPVSSFTSASKASVASLPSSSTTTTTTTGTSRFASRISPSSSSSASGVAPWITAASESFTYNDQTSRDLLLFLRKYRKYYHDNVASQSNSLSILLRPANQPSLRSIPYDGSAFRVVRPLNSYGTSSSMVNSTINAANAIEDIPMNITSSVNDNYLSNSTQITYPLVSSSSPPVHVSPSVNLPGYGGTGTPLLSNTTSNNDLTTDMLTTSAHYIPSTNLRDRRSSLTTSTSALLAYRRRQSLTNPTGTMLGINPRAFGTPGGGNASTVLSTTSTNIPSLLPPVNVQPHITSLTDMGMNNSASAALLASSTVSYNPNKFTHPSSSVLASSNTGLRGSVLVQQRRTSMTNSFMGNTSIRNTPAAIVNTPGLLLPAPPPENPEDIASRILGALGQLANSTSKPMPSNNGNIYSPNVPSFTPSSSYAVTNLGSSSMNGSIVNGSIVNGSIVNGSIGSSSLVNKQPSMSVVTPVTMNTSSINMTNNTTVSKGSSTVLSENTYMKNTPAPAPASSFVAINSNRKPVSDTMSVERPTISSVSSMSKGLSSTQDTSSLSSSMLNNNNTSMYSFALRDHVTPSIFVSNDELNELLRETSADLSLFQ